MKVTRVEDPQNHSITPSPTDPKTPASNFTISSITRCESSCFFSLIESIWGGIVCLFKTLLCLHRQESNPDKPTEPQKPKDEPVVSALDNEPEKPVDKSTEPEKLKDEPTVSALVNELEKPVDKPTESQKSEQVDNDATDLNPLPHLKASVAIRAAAATLPANRRESLNLSKTLKELEALYEAILADLKKVALEEGQELFNRLQSLYQSQLFEWTRISEDPNAEPSDLKCIDKICFIEDNFFYLRSLRCSLFMRSFGMNDQGVVEVPGDGNCLYHSVLEKLAALGLVGAKTSHMDLRNKVVSWLDQNKNDPQVVADLRDSMSAFREMKKERIEFELNSNRQALENEREFLAPEEIERCIKEFENAEKQLEELNHFDVTAYLEHAKRPGFFSGAAELYALSKMYDVTIRVRQRFERNYLDPGSDRLFNEGKEKKITLIYEMDGAHFNLLMAEIDA